MRAPACLLLSCVALAAAGCGFGDEPERAASTDGRGGESPPIVLPPEPTPQPLAFAGGARAALASGAIGVVDTTNRASVAPSRMDVNREQRVDGLTWSGWGLPVATGRGEVSTLICDPNCATGTRETSRAVIVLSKPRSCDGRRFYTRSSMTFAEPGSGKTRAPATYLRAPC